MQPGKQFLSAPFQLTATVRRSIMRAMKWSFSVALLLVSAICVHAGSLFEIPVKDIDGKDASLNAYKGKVMLIVNVASKCGYTPQYEGLEAVHEKYKAKGFTVLGFPCNQFGGQEPGTNDQIKQFCSSTYHVTFPLFDKIDVNGEHRHPLYGALAGKDSPYPGDIKWNFGKFLIGRDGEILKRFDSKVKPDSPEMTEAIEAALAAR
jgi:glutathione peroxidase